MAAKKRAMTAEDLLDFKFLRSLDISPDGSRIVYAMEWIDKKENKYFSNLWLYDAETEEHRQFTFGNNSDREPRFSPDGSQIVFCSARDKKDGIYMMAVDGGAERNLVSKRGSFGSVSFSNDGKQLLYAFRTAYNAPKDESEKAVKESQKAPVYRHITRLFFRLDGDGWRPEDGYHIWRYDLEAEKEYQVTKGKRDEINPMFSPDGKKIVYITNRHRDPDRNLQLADIVICDLNGKDWSVIKKPAGPADAVSFSPDGKFVAFIGNDNPDDAWGSTNLNLWVAPVKGGKAKNITKKHDATLYDPTISDMAEGFGSFPPIWSANGRRLYYLAPTEGSNLLYSIPRGGGKIKLEVDGKFDILRVRPDRKRNTFALAIADPKSPGEVWTYRPGAKPKQRLTCHTEIGAPIFKEVGFVRPKEVRFKSYDGTKVHGWIMKPFNFKKNRKYPAIVEVHGGPRAQYGNTLFHEMQYLAAKGYVVFYCNPRGSQGYGERFTKAIVGDWGTVDYEDVMAGTDYLCSLPYVNPKRVGITGGSYGGYMTSWVVGHTNRFKAAVTQRSVTNLVSFFGSSDVGFGDKIEFGGIPWDGFENLVRQSPITYVKNIRTPLLIIHSENDLRCHIEQSDQLFASLKYMGRKVEYVRFPEEFHGLSRHGRPDRRLARLKFISDWFDKYMKK